MWTSGSTHNENIIGLSMDPWGTPQFGAKYRELKSQNNLNLSDMI